MIILKDKEKLILDLELSYFHWLQDSSIDLSKTAQEFLLLKIKKEIHALYIRSFSENCKTLVRMLPVLGMFADAFDNNHSDRNNRYVFEVSKDEVSEIRAISTNQCAIVSSKIQAILENYRDLEAEMRHADHRNENGQPLIIINLKSDKQVMEQIEAQLNAILESANIRLSNLAKEILLEKIKSEIKKLYYPTLGESFATLACMLPLGGLGKEVMKSHERAKMKDENGMYLLKINSCDPSELQTLRRENILILNKFVNALLEKYRDYEAERKQAEEERQREHKQPSNDYLPYRTTVNRATDNYVSLTKVANGARKTPCDDFCVIL